MGDDKTIFFQKIDDCLLDEKKVVTYKWLSQFLNIHVNQAKELLAGYEEALDPELRQQVEVIYVIGGQLKSGNGFSFQIVKDVNLANAIQHFSIVTTQHIYSLEMMPLPDINYLFTVDYVEGDIERECQGAITCRRSKKKTQEENLARRQKVNPDFPVPSTSTNYEPMDFDDEPSESRKRTPPPSTSVSKTAAPEKRSKLAESSGPKVPDLLLNAKGSSEINTSTGTKPSSSATAFGVKANNLAASTAASKATGKGKAGANTKPKKSKKIFGDTPERRVQTSLTAFFKKE